MPDIRARCPSCSTAFKVGNPNLAGKTVKCPKCATPFRLPAAPPPPMEIPEEPIEFPPRVTPEPPAKRSAASRAHEPLKKGLLLGLVGGVGVLGLLGAV